jgi:hypothetical protein
MNRKEFIFGAILAIIMLGINIYINNTHIKIQYDCRLAEISVDYPQQVKDKCRRLNAHNA